MRSPIGRLASSPVATVAADSLVSDGLSLMCARGISSLIVLAKDKPVGILTERDIVFAANWMLGQSDLKVGQVMNTQVMIVNKGMTIKEACGIFQDNIIRHLVVVDNREEMTGVFTRTDLVKVLDKNVFSGVDDISALMSPKILSVSPETPARYALSLMARHAISGVLVKDGLRPLGFFTEKDVVRLIISGQDLTNCPITAASMSPLVTTSPETTPAQALTLMNRESVRRLLVVDQDETIAGVLTQTDLSRRLDCCKISARLPGTSQTIVSAKSDDERICI